MIGKIIDGVSRGLYGDFGDGYGIHAKRDVLQRLAPPCFYIAALSPSLTRKLGDAYLLDVNLDVHYFPAEDYDNAEMHAVATRMWTALELIETDNGPVRGDGMRHRIVDGVLHFFITYKCFLRREIALEMMREINITTETTEG